ncbi:MAG: rRNA maturation RNase YbeY [Burkholderiales bacterium]|jgi:probable rRNA maturation factor
MKPEVKLSLQFARDDRVRSHRIHLPRAKVLRWLKTALSLPSELTVRIVGEAEGRSLNQEYRHKDYATNVLTFPYEQAPVVMADLVLCADVVEREALLQGLPLQAHYAHLLIHGALHAQGYDHETEKDAVVMEKLETQFMCKLGFKSPY